MDFMKYLANFFALIGLCATVMAVSFYVGYTTYQPKCSTVAALLTENCKESKHEH